MATSATSTISMADDAVPASGTSWTPPPLTSDICSPHPHTQPLPGVFLPKTGFPPGRSLPGGFSPKTGFPPGRTVSSYLASFLSQFQSASLLRCGLRFTAGSGSGTTNSISYSKRFCFRSCSVYLVSVMPGLYTIYHISISLSGSGHGSKIGPLGPPSLAQTKGTAGKPLSRAFQQGNNID